MSGPGARRNHIARTLNSAYAGGLLSQDTFAARLDQLLGGGLIDRRRLVGDLTLRGSRRRFAARLAAIVEHARARLGHAEEPLLLALDWSGAQAELIVGRHPDCDLVLVEPTVSRCHARLVFRDGTWILHDLESKNGTLLNGRLVRRCALAPGDLLDVGGLRLLVD